MMTDPIADMLSRIRNAYMIGDKEVILPYSRFKEAIIKVLKAENYILDYQKTKTGLKQFLTIHLRYSGKVPAISHLQRLSKPGLRKYTSYDKIPRPLQGLGLVILSTPQGVIDGKQARRKRIGGELICEVY